MGMNVWGKTCCTHPCNKSDTKKFEVVSKDILIKFPNPDPKRFEILDFAAYPPYLLVKVKYPDCTNFEGIKIMLYKDVTINELRSLTSLDPHFQESKFSPVMRIIPTESGWRLGVNICYELHMVYVNR